MKKKILLALGGLAVLMVGGVAGGLSWLKGRLTKEALVAQMESAWNCRAQLDSTSVSLSGNPASVRLAGLKLAARDAEVSKELKARPLLADGAVQLSANEVVLAVQLSSLLKGTLDIEKLRVDGLLLRNTVDESGQGSLDALFQSPSDEPVAVPSAAGTTGSAGQPAPEAVAPPAVPAPAPAPEPSAPVEEKKEEEKKPMKAGDLRVNLAVKEASVNNGRLELADLKGGTRTTVDGLSFALTDIDVVPGDLANHNLCRFNVEGKLVVEKTGPAQRFVDLHLAGQGTLEPFDPATGLWRPDTNLTVTLRKGSLLGGAPLEKQMKKKDREKFAKLGLEMGDIALGGVLEQDAVAQIHALPSGKLIMSQDTTLAFAQYEIMLVQKSWFHGPQDAHNVGARLTVSAELSKRILEGAKKALAEKVDAGFLNDLVVEGLAKSLMDKEGRLVLPYRAKGKLSSPEPDFEGLLDDLLDIGAKNLLEGLFKK